MVAWLFVPEWEGGKEGRNGWKEEPRKSRTEHRLSSEQGTTSGEPNPKSQSPIIVLAPARLNVWELVGASPRRVRLRVFCYYLPKNCTKGKNILPNKGNTGIIMTFCLESLSK